MAKPSKFVPPEVSVKFTEVDVAGVPHPAPAVASKAYWAVQISNIPRTSEYGVVKPFSNCLELHLLDVELVSVTFSPTPQFLHRSLIITTIAGKETSRKANPP